MEERKSLEGEKEKLKQKKLRQKIESSFNSKNWHNAIIVIVILVGYTFFFLSKDIFQHNEVTIEATKINSEIIYKERTISLVRWDYSPKEKKCEIEMDITNSTLDGNNKYILTAFSRNSNQEKILETREIISNSTLLIFEILDVPDDYVELALHVRLDGALESDKAKLFATKNSVTIKETLPDRTLEEYKENRLRLQIDENTKLIKKNEKDIDNRYKRIEELKTQIEVFKEEAQYQVEEKYENTMELINKAESEIERTKEQIEELNTQNRRIGEIIEKITQQIKDKA